MSADLTTQPAWNDAMRVYVDALAAETAYDDGPYAEARERRDRQGDMALFDDRWTFESDRLCDIRFAAEGVLISTPAPHLAAAIWKIEHARRVCADFEDWPDAWWDAVMADLHRLAATPAADADLAPGQLIEAPGQALADEGAAMLQTLYPDPATHKAVAARLLTRARRLIGRADAGAQAVGFFLFGLSEAASGRR